MNQAIFNDVHLANNRPAVSRDDTVYKEAWRKRTTVW